MFKSVPFSVPSKIFLNIFTEKLRHNFFESFFFRNFEFETVLKTPAGQLACDPAVWYYTPWTNSRGTMVFFSRSCAITDRVFCQVCESDLFPLETVDYQFL